MLTPSQRLDKNAGTSMEAGPCMASLNAAAPLDGSKLISTVCAPAAFATSTKPAAGYTLPDVPMLMNKSQDSNA